MDQLWIGRGTINKHTRNSETPSDGSLIGNPLRGTHVRHLSNFMKAVKQTPRLTCFQVSNAKLHWPSPKHRLVWACARFRMNWPYQIGLNASIDGGHVLVFLSAQIYTYLVQKAATLWTSLIAVNFKTLHANSGVSSVQSCFLLLRISPLGIIKVNYVDGEGTHKLDNTCRWRYWSGWWIYLKRMIKHSVITWGF